MAETFTAAVVQAAPVELEQDISDDDDPGTLPRKIRGKRHRVTRRRGRGRHEDGVARVEVHGRNVCAEATDVEDAGAQRRLDLRPAP